MPLNNVPTYIAAQCSCTFRTLPLHTAQCDTAHCTVARVRVLSSKCVVGSLTRSAACGAARASFSPPQRPSTPSPTRHVRVRARVGPWRARGRRDKLCLRHNRRAPAPPYVPHGPCGRVEVNLGYTGVWPVCEFSPARGRGTPWKERADENQWCWPQQSPENSPHPDVVGSRTPLVAVAAFAVVFRTSAGRLMARQ